jgi:hypothetical protein
MVRNQLEKGYHAAHTISSVIRKLPEIKQKGNKLDDMR